MNENTTKLLQQLAEKLGTTTQYLWNVLLKQAPIAATTTLIQMILILGFGYGLWRIHKFLSKKQKGEYGHSLYYEYEEAAAIPMILAAIAFGILLIVAFFCIGDVVNGYFNPEYWALKTVLNSVK